jgi:hypothetical protein
VDTVVASVFALTGFRHKAIAIKVGTHNDFISVMLDGGVLSFLLLRKALE